MSHSLITFLCRRKFYNFIEFSCNCVTGALQVWTHGWDTVPHSEHHRPILGAPKHREKEASASRSHRHASRMQVRGSDRARCGGSDLNIRPRIHAKRSAWNGKLFKKTHWICFLFFCRSIVFIWTSNKLGFETVFILMSNMLQLIWISMPCA